MGAIAAVGTRHASARWTRLTALIHRAPYLSGPLLLVGCYLGAIGLARLL